MRKWQLGAAGFLLVTVAAFSLLLRVLNQPSFLNPPPSGSVRVLFSNGHVEHYPTSRLDDFKWIPIKPQAYNPTFTKQLTLASARFIGLRKYPVPNPPALVPLEAHLAACGQYTHQSFFLHESLTNYLGQLSFLFGGAEHTRTSSEWVEANINSIRTNRVAIGPIGSQRYLSCAVLVSQDTIRIIPEAVLLGASEKRPREPNL
jgi:hypothetical protein